MRAQAADLLTLLRFPLAAALLAVEVLSAPYLILYGLCCLTDVLDGWTARRLGACSVRGARLDSAADAVLVAVLLVTLWPVLPLGGGLGWWIAAVAAVRLAAAGAALARFGRAGFLHTWGNKATGLLLAAYPLSLALWPGRGPLLAVLAVASLSAVEELAVELTAPTWQPDRRSLLCP